VIALLETRQFLHEPLIGLGMTRSVALLKLSCGVMVFYAILLAVKPLLFFWSHHNLYWTIEAAKILTLAIAALLSPLRGRVPHPEQILRTRLAWVSAMAGFSIVGDAGINAIRYMIH
jgi:hypothetical protein